MQPQPETLSAPGAQHYVNQFDRLKENLPGSATEWLIDQRKQNLARFNKAGFPSQKDEDWRYTPLRPITNKLFEVVSDKPNHGIDLESHQIPYMDCYQVVFVDGYLDLALSNLGMIQSGISIEALETVLTQRPETIKNKLGSIINHNGHSFTALNGALYNNGIVINLEENAKLDMPVELLFISNTEMAMTHPKNLVLAGKNSNAEIIERYVSTVSATDFHSLVNSTTEIILGEAAEIDYYMVQTQSSSAYQISGIWVSQGPNSRFGCRTISLGGGLVRNDLRVELNGSKAHCDMYGVYSLAGKQHVDNHTTMIHQAESCTSNELYKGILDQRSRAVFHGRIKVAKGAQKTDANQSNNTLLLSRDSEIDTKPQLEIYADDVKCSHGATIGQLDEAALFYLRTRGIDPAEARSLLTYAFVNDVINQIEIEPLREFLEQRMSSQLIKENLRLT